MLEQILDADPESLRELREVEHRDIPHAALDAAHIGAVNLAQVGERLLGELPLLAQGADALPETAEDGVGCLRHPEMVGGCGLLGHGR